MVLLPTYIFPLVRICYQIDSSFFLLLFFNSMNYLRKKNFLPSSLIQISSFKKNPSLYFQDETQVNGKFSATFQFNEKLTCNGVAKENSFRIVIFSVKILLSEKVMPDPFDFFFTRSYIKNVCAKVIASVYSCVWRQNTLATIGPKEEKKNEKQNIFHLVNQFSEVENRISIWFYMQIRSNFKRTVKKARLNTK